MPVRPPAMPPGDQLRRAPRGNWAWATAQTAIRRPRLRRRICAERLNKGSLTFPPRPTRSCVLPRWRSSVLGARWPVRSVRSVSGLRPWVVVVSFVVAVSVRCARVAQPWRPLVAALGTHPVRRLDGVGGAQLLSPRMRLSLRSLRVSCPLRAALIVHGLPRALLGFSVTEFRTTCVGAGRGAASARTSYFGTDCVCSHFVLRNASRPTTRTSCFAALRVSSSSRCRCVCSCFALRNASRPRPLHGVSIPQASWRGSGIVGCTCGVIGFPLRGTCVRRSWRCARPNARRSSGHDGVDGVLADRFVARNATDCCATRIRSARGAIAGRSP